MLKRFLLIIGLLVLLLVGALIAALMLFNPNDYKDEISSLAREHTGRELRIVDDLHLSIFPWLGLKTGRIEFANAQGFGPEPFARFDDASIQVRLMPLFSRRFEIDTVTLRGLVLHLERDANGHSNWDDLAAAASGEAPQDAPPADAGDVAAALPVALTIGGLELRDAELYWRDRSAGSDIEVTHIDLSSGKIEDGHPVDLKLSFDVRSAQPALAGHIDFSSRLTALLGEQRVHAEELRLQARLQSADLPGGKADISLSADVTADLPAEIATVSNLALQAYGMQISGAIDAAAITSAPSASGKITVAEFNPRTLFKALGEEAPVTTDPAALTRAAAALSFEASTDYARVSDIDVRLDDTHLRGKVGVRSFEQPAIDFSLAVDGIDLDRYLPPGEEAPTGAVAAAPVATALLPVDTLRALNLQGDLSIGHLRTTGLALSDLQVFAQARSGLLRFSPMRAALYEGKYEGEITIDARDNTPKVELAAALSSVQAKPLLSDLLDLKMISGNADFTLSVRTQGNTEPEFRRALDGKGRFVFHDGAIEGFNAAQLIRDAKARLQGGNVSANAARTTDFTETSGSFVITKGVLRNEDLSGSSPYLRLAGAGSADLNAETVDYRLRVRIVDTSAGQGGAGLDDVKGLDIPIRIQGSWAQPNIGIDGDFVKNALRQAIEKYTGAKQQEIRQKVEEKVQEVQQKAQEKVGDKLKGLFK
ncbi:MAG: AsmA family protein [Chromatiales bacterium]|jgi:AsmA protein|nr:AsmA family protein [Chromatiales bacterium]